MAHPIHSDGSWNLTAKPIPMWNLFRSILRDGIIVFVVPAKCRNTHMELAAAKPKYSPMMSHFAICSECQNIASMVIICTVGNMEYKKNICNSCQQDVRRVTSVNRASFLDDIAYSDGYYYQRKMLEPTLKCKIVCPVCRFYSEFRVCGCYTWIIRGWITSKLPMLMQLKRDLCTDVIGKILTTTRMLYF